MPNPTLCLKFLRRHAFRLGALALAFTLSSPAFAQEKSIVQEGSQRYVLKRVVSSGTNRLIGFYTWLSPDCSVIGDTEVRIIKKPMWGTAEAVEGEFFSTYGKDHVLASCNTKKTKGMMLYYKSKKDSVGTDTFEVLVLSPLGTAQEVQYDIDVK